MPVAFKVCSYCKIEKAAEFFAIARKEPCGLTSRCRACKNLTAKGYKKPDPAKRVQSTMRWQAKNPDKVKGYRVAAYENYAPKHRANMKRKYAEDRDAIRAADRERYATDPAYRAMKLRKCRESYVRRHVAIRAQAKVYRAENPDLIATHANNARLRREQAEGRTTHAQWCEIVEAFDNHCAYCLRPASVVGKLTRDHMDAITGGGTNWPENLAPACKPCNSSKNSKSVVEFALAQRRHGADIHFRQEL